MLGQPRAHAVEALQRPGLGLGAEHPVRPKARGEANAVLLHDEGRDPFGADAGDDEVEAVRAQIHRGEGRWFCHDPIKIADGLHIKGCHRIVTPGAGPSRPWGPWAHLAMVKTAVRSASPPAQVTLSLAV